MNLDVIPLEVRRFLQTTAVTIPHIEMMLLLRREPAMAWAARDVARRIYLQESKAEELLAQIAAIGIVERSGAEVVSYYYRPSSPELAALMEMLESVYSKHLLAVTKLVHAARDEGAEQFARAFRFRRDD